jgi:hypothetical protein
LLPYIMRRRASGSKNILIPVILGTSIKQSQTFRSRLEVIQNHGRDAPFFTCKGVS